MGNIIDGKALAKKKQNQIKEKAITFKAANGRPPGIAVILVGDDPASTIYVRNKKQACEKTGVRSYDHHPAADITQRELLDLIERLNDDSNVDGILVQLPLPSHLNEKEILLKIDPGKDVDGFHPYNLGRLFMGNPVLMPCTPRGIMYMLQEYGASIDGKDAIIIGRSNIVGKPMAIMLMMAHATVSIAHSHTRDLARKISGSDIVVAAIGKPHMIKGDWIKEDAVVIDVGMNRTEKGLVGDVEFDQAKKRASLITPVPGGVGPMTITMLLENTLIAAKEHIK